MTKQELQEAQEFAEANGLTVGGIFTFEHVRDAKIIDTWEQANLVVNEGLNHMLNVVLNNATQVATWYIGLFKANYTPTASLTAATVAATATESSDYTEGTRVEYVEAASTAQSITNSANKATFTINATVDMYGAFLISASAKQAITGTLFAASQFSSARSVVALDELLVTYTVTAASA